jgi:transcription-repair coupling factor (superfamily II helicase)
MSSCTVEEVFARADFPSPLGSLRRVAPEARAFVLAAMARTTDNVLWVVCADVRGQEDLASELAGWHPQTRCFPSLPHAPEAAILADPETTAERLEILAAIGAGTLRGPLVLHHRQLEEPVPRPASLLKGGITLRRGLRLNPATLAGCLVSGSYEPSPQVAVRGHFSRRGGIFDVFPRQSVYPVRIEFDDDEIASVRAFDPDTQVSSAEIPEAQVLIAHPGGETREVPLRSLVGDRALLVGVGEIGELEGALRVDDAGGEGEEFFPLPFGTLAAGDLVLDEARAGMFFGQLERWRDDGWMVVLAAASEGEAGRFREFCSERGHDVAWVGFLPLALSLGFVVPGRRLAVLPDAGIFGRGALLRAGRLAARRHRAASKRTPDDFSDFEEGDFVVHTDHGIGRFEGLVPSPEGTGGEVLAIAFAGDSRLYVPISQAWEVSRYAGLGRARPSLSELGGNRWQKAKDKAVASVFDYAARILRVQAERESLEGHAFAPDTHWQVEFEATFPYAETPDQIRAIAETKRDMELPKPMDRLVCGDVGFGKTEVAVRAVFKAVMDGKQVAFLAPTTVLARQHFQTLRERMSEFPVVIELLTRFRTPAAQRRVVRGLGDGSVDVVVGTHRLVSPDVGFRNIGLVVVDEEQRFGVRQKDLLKERFRQIDVLTLSATPIPRTLYMALTGARDMSLIETPPPNRQPVETVVCAYDERVMRDAILRELERGGQVYVLHNRVRTIERLAQRVRHLCPAARIAVGHGQMDADTLESVMEAFVDRRTDVLVSTTIIESGLDIPNANTIIIDRADLFGMADLYQLRGRVGRAGRKAYAYLMLPRDLMGEARRRVSAIKQYSELGSGFKVAMRDLELRGAGNMLGTAQSGHILAVGFDLYCRLLRRAVDTLANNARFTRAECPVRLDFVVTEESLHAAAAGDKAPAFLPASYIPDAKIRIACHRHLAEAASHEDLESLRTRWRDRFGPLPRPVENALALAGIGIAAAAKRLTAVETKDAKLLLSRRAGLIQHAGRFPRLTLPDPVSRLTEVRTMIDSLENE